MKFKLLILLFIVNPIHLNAREMVALWENGAAGAQINTLDAAQIRNTFNGLHDSFNLEELNTSEEEYDQMFQYFTQVARRVASYQTLMQFVSQELNFDESTKAELIRVLPGYPMNLSFLPIIKNLILSENLSTVLAGIRGGGTFQALHADVEISIPSILVSTWLNNQDALCFFSPQGNFYRKGTFIRLINRIFPAQSIPLSGTCTDIANFLNLMDSSGKYTIDGLMHGYSMKQIRDYRGEFTAHNRVSETFPKRFYNCFFETGKVDECTLGNIAKDCSDHRWFVRMPLRNRSDTSYLNVSDRQKIQCQRSASLIRELKNS